MANGWSVDLGLPMALRTDCADPCRLIMHSMFYPLRLMALCCRTCCNCFPMAGIPLAHLLA